MPFTPPIHTPFQWHDLPALDTPIDAANLIGAETDIVSYIQSVITAYDTYAQSTFVYVPSPTVGDGVVWNGGAWVSAPVFSAATAANPNGSATIGTSSVQLVASNASRGAIQIWNLDNAGVIFGALGATAVVNQGFVIYPGGTWSSPANTGQIVFTGAINLISTLASVAVSYVEV